MGTAGSDSSRSTHLFQAPTGTRDLYPQDILRRRYLAGAWRDAAVRHGFEQIDGPTFEHLDLYTRKSGDEIVSQLFSFRREGGQKDYALRPELTPTVARMYAGRAGSLPRPAKWFSIGPFFRAERPQRGRLREFWQWNVDVLGLPGGVNAEGAEEDAKNAEIRTEMDAELIACCVAFLVDVGLSPAQTAVKFNDREVVAALLEQSGVAEANMDRAFALLDRWDRLDQGERDRQSQQIGLNLQMFDAQEPVLIGAMRRSDGNERVAGSMGAWGHQVVQLEATLDRLGLSGWHIANLGIVRGLAYYTGMVFEVIAEGERAVAGGGRYDNLIELFGGAPTPAVGFAMGDVVISLLLQDKGLMPEGRDLLEAVNRPGASLRPDAFVIAGGRTPGDAESARAQVTPTLAKLRRGVESESWLEREDRKPWDADRYDVPPLHARCSYKATKNVGKLLKDAAAQHARFAVIIENGSEATLKNMDTGEQTERVAVEQVGPRIAEARARR